MRINQPRPTMNPLPNLLPNLLPLRLPPGADLRLSLESHCKAGDAGGYFVLSGIGSLHDPRIRFAGEDEARVLRGPFEVVCLQGTITVDGAHLHVVVSDSRGRVLGGHLASGSLVRTTAEILLVRPDGWRLGRQHDPDTGFAEFIVRPEPAARRLDAEPLARP